MSNHAPFLTSFFDSTPPSHTVDIMITTVAGETLLFNHDAALILVVALHFSYLQCSPDDVSNLPQIPQYFALVVSSIYYD